MDAQESVITRLLEIAKRTHHQCSRRSEESHERYVIEINIVHLRKSSQMFLINPLVTWGVLNHFPFLTLQGGSLSDWLVSFAFHLHVEILEAHDSDALVEQASGTLQLHPIVDPDGPTSVFGLGADADLVEHHGVHCPGRRCDRAESSAACRHGLHERSRR